MVAAAIATSSAPPTSRRISIGSVTPAMRRPTPARRRACGRAPRRRRRCPARPTPRSRRRRARRRSPPTAWCCRCPSRRARAGRSRARRRRRSPVRTTLLRTGRRQRRLEADVAGRLADADVDRGRPRRRRCRANALIVDRPWRYAANIASVTPVGYALTLAAAATPWSAAKMSAGRPSIAGRSVRCHPATHAAISSSQANAPLGRRMWAARSCTAAHGASSAVGRSRSWSWRRLIAASSVSSRSPQGSSRRSARPATSNSVSSARAAQSGSPCRGRRGTGARVGLGVHAHADLVRDDDDRVRRVRRALRPRSPSRSVDLVVGRDRHDIRFDTHSVRQSTIESVVGVPGARARRRGRAAPRSSTSPVDRSAGGARSVRACRRRTARPVATSTWRAPRCVAALPSCTASALLPLRAPPMRNVSVTHARSVVDARFGADALLVRVLDLAHLGDGVGDVDQLGRRIAPGDDDVDVRGAGRDRRRRPRRRRSSPSSPGMSARRARPAGARRR